MSTNAVNSSSNQTYGQAETTYVSDRGGVVPMSRSRKKAATPTQAASTVASRPIKKPTKVVEQAESETKTIPVVEKHGNGDVTFHLQGYPPVTCEKIEGSSDGSGVTSYRTKMSDEKRMYEDHKRISMMMKQLQKMFDAY